MIFITKIFEIVGEISNPFQLMNWNDFDNLMRSRFGKNIISKKTELTNSRFPNKLLLHSLNIPVEIIAKAMAEKNWKHYFREILSARIGQGILPEIQKIPNEQYVVNAVTKIDNDLII